MRFWPRLVVTGLVAVVAAASSWLGAEAAGGQVAAWAAAGIAATVVVTLGAVWVSRDAGQHRPKVDKRRAYRRARFASAMVEQVASISRLEEWQDDRFAELDAEVEIHGRQRRGLLRRRRRETIRRVPTLS